MTELATSYIIEQLEEQVAKLKAENENLKDVIKAIKVCLKLLDSYD